MTFDSFNHKFVMNLKRQLFHNLEVGSDPLGMNDAPEEENEGQETSGHDVQKSKPAFEDVGIDILTGNRIDLDILEYIPDIKGNPQAMEMITELVAKLPEMEEQNYNMVDNVLNNGAEEKAQKEENKKAQDRLAAKPSL